MLVARAANTVRSERMRKSVVFAFGFRRFATLAFSARHRAVFAGSRFGKFFPFVTERGFARLVVNRVAHAAMIRNISVVNAGRLIFFYGIIGLMTFRGNRFRILFGTTLRRAAIKLLSLFGTGGFHAFFRLFRVVMRRSVGYRALLFFVATRTNLFFFAVFYTGRFFDDLPFAVVTERFARSPFFGLAAARTFTFFFRRGFAGRGGFNRPVAERMSERVYGFELFFAA